MFCTRIWGGVGMPQDRDCNIITTKCQTKTEYDRLQEKGCVSTILSKWKGKSHNMLSFWQIQGNWFNNQNFKKEKRQ